MGNERKDGYVLKVDRGRRYWDAIDGSGKAWIDTPPDDVLREFYSAIDAPTTVVITEAGRRQIGVPPKAQPAPPEEPLPAGAPRSDS